MTLKECYALIGGDYNEIINALGSEGIVSKFLIKLIDEKTYATLEEALDNKSYVEAFRAAHTLKGICLNLSLKSLYNLINPLTEELRSPASMDLANVDKLYKSFMQEYNKTIDIISDYKNQ